MNKIHFGLWTFDFAYGLYQIALHPEQPCLSPVVHGHEVSASQLLSKPAACESGLNRYSAFRFHTLPIAL
jgi:hypothetical protein